LNPRACQCGSRQVIIFIVIILTNLSKKTGEKNYPLEKKGPRKNKGLTLTIPEDIDGGLKESWEEKENFFDNSLYI
jgi:hypothetical protein